MPKHPGRASILLYLTLTLLLLSGCSVSDGTSESSTLQTSAQRTGVYNTKGPRPSPSVAWKFKTDGEINSSPAIADDTVYVGSNDTHLYALDSSNGQFRWNLKTGGKVRSSPIVQEGVVYVGSDDGALYATDSKTGTEKWKAKTYGYFILLDKQGICCEDYLKTDLPPPSMEYLMTISDSSGWGISASPVITGGHVYFGTDRAYFYAADLATGKIIWVSATQSGITSTAAIEGDALYYVSDGGSLYSIDAKTQRGNWQFYAQHDFYESSIVVADESVYLAGRSWTMTGQDGGSTLLAVDSLTGKEKWRFHEKGYTTAPIVSGDSVYFTAGERLYALDAQTGAKLWEFDTGRDISAAPAMADGLLYVTNSDGYLYAVDAGTGQVAWKFKAGSAITSAPAIADGMVYFGCEDGYLYALK